MSVALPVMPVVDRRADADRPSSVIPKLAGTTSQRSAATTERATLLDRTKL
jgi:hypothetical protein